MSANIEAKQHPNGQYEIKSGNLTLIHSNFKGLKFNECTEDKTDYIEMCNPYEPRFKPLFIALHNFKSNQ